MATARGLVRFVAWCAGLAVVLFLLHGWEVPGAGGPVDLASRDPADLVPVLLTGARWVALGCAWYLASVTVLSAVSALVGWRPLRQLDAVVTLPAVRRLVRAGLGATLAVGVTLGPSAAAAAAPGPPGASARPAPLAQLDEEPDNPSSHGRGHTSADAVPDVPTEHGTSAEPAGDDLDAVPPPQVAPPRGGADDPSRPAGRPPGAPAGRAPAAAGPETAAVAAEGTGASGAADGPAPERPPRAAGGSGDADAPPAAGATEGDAPSGTHVVVEGESFWSIAADHTAAELGSEPDVAEVFERWVVLIEANRDRLHVPGDPDLLLPGQELRVPEEAP